MERRARRGHVALAFALATALVLAIATIGLLRVERTGVGRLAPEPRSMVQVAGERDGAVLPARRVAAHGGHLGSILPLAALSGVLLVALSACGRLRGRTAALARGSEIRSRCVGRGPPRHRFA